jgi:glycerol dehydrogenase-like iron-containing ADH family enzyme
MQFKREYEAKRASVTGSLDNAYEMINEEREDIQLAPLLQAMGCPTHYTDLGVSEEVYQTAVFLACFTRDRFTFLDLL